VVGECIIERAPRGKLLNTLASEHESTRGENTTTRRTGAVVADAWLELQVPRKKVRRVVRVEIQTV
jgi:hypothetical protein